MGGVKGLAKIVSGTGKAILKAGRATGKFLYELGKGVTKGLYKGTEGVIKVYNPKNSSKNLDDSSDFFETLRMSKIPEKNYNDISSIVRDGYSEKLSSAEKVEKALNILDRMHEDKYISGRTHDKLKNKLYFSFKNELKRAYKPEFLFRNYLPFATAIIFLFFGIFLLFNGFNITGFSVSENINLHLGNLFGILFLFFALSFFGLFMRRLNKNRFINS